MSEEDVLILDNFNTCDNRIQINLLDKFVFRFPCFVIPIHNGCLLQIIRAILDDQSNLILCFEFDMSIRGAFMMNRRASALR